MSDHNRTNIQNLFELNPKWNKLKVFSLTYVKRPVYKLTIDIDDEGMDFIGLVDYPAHGKNYITMSKAPKKGEPKFQFNEEKQIVTSVEIATDLLIFRRDPDGFEYDVYFSKKDTLTIMKMFAKRGYHNNVNLMHDMNQKVEDAYMVESYFINEKKTNIPEEFANQNLQPGSLIFSYWIEGAKTWEFVKENGAGFSLEGWFKEIEVKFVKQKKKQMKLMEKLGFSKKSKPVFDKENKDKYAEATTVDGLTVMWDGALEVGNALFLVNEEGEEVLAPAEVYSFEVDGVMMIVSVDEAGAITNVEEAEEMEEEEEEMEEVSEAMQAMKEDYETKLAKQKEDSDGKIEVLATAVDNLTEAFEKFADKKAPKKVKQNSDEPAWKQMKNKNNKKN